MKLTPLVVILLASQFTYAQQKSFTGNQNWTNYVRTAGHGLSATNIDATIKDAVETHLYGIEVDNDIPGRYDSFLDPTQKLKDMKALADKAHAINNKAFVYIAGLECITPNADKREHTFFKDHPDWVQRDINGKPAKFGGGDAFWISGGDEDVWISPYATEWRKLFMKQIRQIAATGIDGIFVDVPYWMTHFDGWNDSWASFDDYTVEAFRKKTGLNAKKDLKLGDYSDANFRKWVAFRIETLTDFMAEIAANAKSVNPECKTIAEIYPGLGEEAVRVGADVYDMYKVVDVVAHEFSGGGGNAASKDPLHWFDRMVGMYTFRSFAQGKASWMLSYSWGEENKINPVEPMKNLALSNVMAGTNHWDARGHVMSGSNDIATRKLIYKWIADNENTFYKPRNVISPVGVYFSPATRNYYPDTFMDSFQGVMKMMLQGHLEFQVVTPATLNDFKGETLILPDVKCISESEVLQLTHYVQGNGKLVLTGETGKLNDEGALNPVNPVHRLLGVTSAGKEATSSKDRGKFNYYPECPGKQYTAYTQKGFNEAAWSGQYQSADFFKLLTTFKNTLAAKDAVVVNISPFVSAQVATVEGLPHVFLANFAGLKNDTIATQTLQEAGEVSFSGKTGKVYFLPFLGEKTELKTELKNGRVTAKLPAIQKGAVIWLAQ